MSNTRPRLKKMKKKVYAFSRTSNFFKKIKFLKKRVSEKEFEYVKMQIYERKTRQFVRI